MNSDLPTADTLAVLILFHEKPQQTIECLASVLPSGARIHVLNNGSSEPATRMIEEFSRPYPQIALWRAPRNLGVAAGRNLLTARTSEPWLLFMDSDAYIATSGWLSILTAAVAHHPASDAFFPQIFHVHEPHDGKAGDVVIEDGVMSTRPHNEPETNLISGTACFARRSLFERLGAYDEQLFVGFEDIEMSVRAIKMGAPIRARYIDEIKVIHEHRPAQSSCDKAAARERYRFETIRASYQHLLKKHELKWDHAWERWIEAEGERIAGKEGPAAEPRAGLLHACKELWSGLLSRFGRAPQSDTAP